MRIVVADTSPLIFLAKLALLEKVCKNFTLITTSVVIDEATWKKDLPDSKYILRMVEKGFIDVHDINRRLINNYQKNWGLGIGEASTFALFESIGDILLIDDYVAITVARTQNINYITTPVLIYEITQRKIISTSQSRHKLIALKEYSWIEDEIIDVVISWFEKGN